MAENEGKKPTASETDDGAPSEKSPLIVPDLGEKSEAKEKRSPDKAVKARPASARSEEEDDDEDEDEDEDEDDEEEDDEDEEEEEEVKAPPPKRSAASKPKGKAAPVVQKKATKGSVYRKAPPRVASVPRKPARYYVPFIGLGLGFVALHVWFDFPFQMIACVGIGIVIWAYMQIGSANEIIPGER